MGATPSIRTRVLWASDREVPILHVMWKKSPTISDLQTADRLSPHPDSQFSVFLYLGCPLDKPRHNRSSSPFTSLADIAECKVASTGAEQPNY